MMSSTLGMSVLIAVALLVFFASPSNYRVGFTISAAFLTYFLGKVFARKYKFTYYTMTDSYAINDNSTMSHHDAHAEMRENA